MASRTQVLIPFVIAAAIIGIVGVLTIPSDTKLETVNFPKGTIKVDNIVLQVEVANTEPARMRGLMFQDKLPFDKGMIFVFDNAQVVPMWMLNMQFSLDVIWFDSKGDVVHIEKNAEPCKSALETVTCTFQNAENKKAKYVLEVTAGFVGKYKITEKSKLQIISI